MPARSYEPPASFVVDEGAWPTGPFRPGTPAYARVVANLVANLRDHMQRRQATLTVVATNAGIDKSSLSRLLAGRTVPDVATLAGLETALDARLWPDRHHTHPQRPDSHDPPPPSDKPTVGY